MAPPILFGMGTGHAAIPELSSGRDSTNASLFSSPSKRNLLCCLFLIVVTLAVYNPITHNGFINIDDNGYLLENKQVQQGLTVGTVRWAFTTMTCQNWHPLTMISHSLDWELFGKNAAGHHYVSLLFHATDAVLLFLLLEAVTGFAWRSLIVAALFALHPVNVESVAWAAERKNVLSMLFFLAALMAYGWYAQRPSLRRYGSVVLLFALGLMAKPQVITFPCVLLLWDYWPLERFGGTGTKEGGGRYAPASFKWLVTEKIPLFLMSAADALLTMLAQRQVVVRAESSYSLYARLSNAIVSYPRYVAHAFWPLHLSPAYSHPGNTIPGWEVALAVGFLIAVTALTLASRKRYLVTGWFWFLGIMVPTIGIIQVGDQAMADRYAYAPYIGLFWMAVWSVADAARDWKISPKWMAVPACAAVAAVAMLTPNQVRQWRDGETLWTYALKANPEGNFLAHSYLAGALVKEGKDEEAIREYKAAERLHSFPADEVGLFVDYELRHGHREDAIADAQRVLEGTKDRQARVLAYRDMGIAYTQIGKADEAKQSYANALQLDPQDGYSLLGMGLLAYRSGDFATASDYFSRTAALDPSDFYYLVLGNALEQQGRKKEAGEAYAKARRASSDWPQALKKAHWFLTN